MSDMMGMKTWVSTLILYFSVVCTSAQVTFNPDPEENVQLQLSVLERVEITTIQCYVSSPQFKIQYATAIYHEVVYTIYITTNGGSTVAGSTCTENHRQYMVPLHSLSFLTKPALVGGTFRLKVTLDDDEGNSSFSKRTYTFPAPFNLTGSSQSAVLNFPFTWSCHVTPDYPAIEWYRAGIAIGQVGILSNGSCVTFGQIDSYTYNCQQSELTYTLTIHGYNITEELQGTLWRCRNAYPLRLAGSKFIKLDIIVPVTSVSISPGSGSTLDVDENQTFIFTCITNYANPPPTILWYLGTADVTTQAGSNGTTLTLPVSKVNHQMSVMCLAWNSGNTVNLSDSTTLDVTYSPMVILEQSSVEVIEGQTAVLRCSATGNPAPNVTWYRGSAAITESTISSSTYSIINVSRTATGNYTCEASSSSTGGSLLKPDRKDLYLRVFYPPTVSLILQNATENAENHVIRCTAVGDPDNATILALQQRIGTALIRNITTFTESSPGNVTWKIARVSYQDLGTYTCLASNGILDRSNQKVQSDTAYFDVLTSAKFETEYYHQVVTPDGTAHVKVPFFCNPPALMSGVEWINKTRMNDQLVESSEIISLSVVDTDVDFVIRNTNITLGGQAAIMNITSVQEYHQGTYVLKIQNGVSLIANLNIKLELPRRPDKPTNLNVKCSEGQAQLTWTFIPNDSTEVSFEVLYKEEDEQTYTVIDYTAVGQNQTLHEKIVNINQNSIYNFKVAAKNVYGRSDYMEPKNCIIIDVKAQSPCACQNVAVVTGGMTAGFLVIIGVLITVIVVRERTYRAAKGIGKSGEKASFEEYDSVQPQNKAIVQGIEKTQSGDQMSTYEELQTQRDVHTYEHVRSKTEYVNLDVL